MSDETIEEIIRKTLIFADGIATFSFQGGEPMLRGLDFYKNVMALEQKYNIKGVRIENCIQTNGILIDEEWATFFHKHELYAQVRYI